MIRSNTTILAVSLVVAGIVLIALICGDDPTPAHQRIFQTPWLPTGAPYGKVAVAKIPFWSLVLSVLIAKQVMRYTKRLTRKNRREVHSVPSDSHKLIALSGESGVPETSATCKYNRERLSLSLLPSMIHWALTGILIALISSWMISYIFAISSSPLSHATACRPAITAENGAVSFITGGMRCSHLRPFTIECTSPWKRLIPRIGATSSSLNLLHLIRTQPLLFAACVFALCYLTAILVIHQIRPEKTPNPCKRCGYSLFGNVSGRCPECGALTHSLRGSAAGFPFLVWKLRTRTITASIILVSTILLSSWPVRSTILDWVLGTNLRERDRVLSRSSREIELALRESVPDYNRATSALQDALGIAGPSGETFRLSEMIYSHRERHRLILDADSALNDGDYVNAEKLYQSAIVIGVADSLEERLRYARARRLLNEALSAIVEGDIAACKLLLNQSLWWMPTPEAGELLIQVSGKSEPTTRSVYSNE